MHQEIGSLMLLDLEDIELTQAVQSHGFLIYGAAKSLESSNGRNWVPAIVKQIGIDKYEAVANHFILTVAKEANLEKVWCIVVDESSESIHSAQLLAQEKNPQIDLAKASFEEIKLGLEFLKERAIKPLKVDINKASTYISEAPRENWQPNLREVTKLKCGITAKSLDIFREVFYTTPTTQPESTKVLNETENSAITAAAGSKSLNKMTVTELKKIAKERGISGYTSMKKAELVNALS